MNIKPVSNKILVEEVKQEEVRASGIILGGNASSNTRTAKVLAVGDSVDPNIVKVGDDAYVDWSKGSMVKIDNRSLVFIDQEFVLGTVG